MNYQPNPGDILLNKYEVISLVGEGAFGCVYRARDTKLNRFVAIKFINPNNQVFDRFMDELDAIKKLDHPNIVRLYDYDILKGGVPCIVMEFVEGRELGDILAAEGPLSIPAICEIALQVLDALVETHKQGIVHCDIKPENIMITNVGARKNVAKLIDFGVASILTKASENSNRQHMLIGTPQYMAPEQILHQPLGPWTDIYAIGLILIELFTGKFVFDSDDPREVLRMQLYSPVELPHALACSELGPIISRAIEKKAENRYKSTQEFYDDVKEATVTMQSVVRQHPMTMQTNLPRNRTVQSLFTDIDDFLEISPYKEDQNRPQSVNVPLMGDPGSQQPQIPILGDPSNDETRVAFGNANPQDNETTRFMSNNPPLLSNPSGFGSDPDATSMGYNIPETKSLTRSRTKSHPKPAKFELDKLQLQNPPVSPVPGAPANAEPGQPSVNIPELTSAPVPGKDDSVIFELKQLPPVDSVQDQNAPDSVSIPDLTKNGFDTDAQDRIKSSTFQSNMPIQKDAPAKNNGLNKLVAIMVGLILLIGGGGYAYYMYNATRKPSIVATPIPDETNEVAAPAPQVKKSFVGFATIRSTAATMAKQAAVAGYIGAQESPGKARTYSIIGTPTDAKIYVNSKLVCSKTPCKAHLYGPAKSIELEIRKGDASNTAKIPRKHNIKSPIIISLR